MLYFLGGLAMFLYGLHEISHSMESILCGRMQGWLLRLTSGRRKTVLLGTALTALLQSSTAVTVLTVGLVEAGGLGLLQAADLVMGANVGTTATAWLVALRELGREIPEWSLDCLPLLLVVGGLAGQLLLEGKQKSFPERLPGGKWLCFCELICGLGFLFLGLQGMERLTVSMPWLTALLADIGESPLLGLGCGILVTCLIQSSSAGIGILQILAMQGRVTLGAGAYVILGQNIGTCLTTLAAGLGVGAAARWVTFFHLGFNLAGAAVMAPMLWLLFVFCPALADSSINAVSLAVFHTCFNVLNVLLVYYFAPRICRQILKREK